MEPSSFTIAIPRHVDAKDRNYWLEWLREEGADVEPLNEDNYRISCSRTRQLEYVGWALYHTALSRISNVLEVSGGGNRGQTTFSAILNANGLPAPPMPRRARLSLPGIAWHIIQRGNNRGVCFFAEEDSATCTG